MSLGLVHFEYSPWIWFLFAVSNRKSIRAFNSAFSLLFIKYTNSKFRQRAKQREHDRGYCVPPCRKLHIHTIDTRRTHKILQMPFDQQEQKTRWIRRRCEEHTKKRRRRHLFHFKCFWILTVGRHCSAETLKQNKWKSRMRKTSKTASIRPITLFSISIHRIKQQKKKSESVQRDSLSSHMSSRARTSRKSSEAHTYIHMRNGDVFLLR